MHVWWNIYVPELFLSTEHHIYASRNETEKKQNKNKTTPSCYPCKNQKFQHKPIWPSLNAVWILGCISGFKKILAILRRKHKFLPMNYSCLLLD